MSKTFLEMTNEVLIKLREDPVTSVTSTNYAQLIAHFLNTSKREVEDAWQWYSLRSTIAVLTEVDIYQYLLPGVGEVLSKSNRFKVLDVLSADGGRRLEQANAQWLTQQFLREGTSNNQPMYFGLNGFGDNNDPVVDLYPTPSREETLYFYLVIPEDDMVLNTDVCKVPAHVVIAGAFNKAKAERGEDTSISNAEYLGALSSAISIEESFTPQETDFYAI